MSFYILNKSYSSDFPTFPAYYWNGESGTLDNHPITLGEDGVIGILVSDGECYEYFTKDTYIDTVVNFATHAEELHFLHSASTTRNVMAAIAERALMADNNGLPIRKDN